MKKILLLFLVFPAILFSQDASENYVKTILHKEEGNASYLNTTPDNTVMVNVTYFDGIGRPKQHIAHAQSGTGGDLITHVEYDGLGREVKQYLPFERSASSSIPFDEYAEVNTTSFYNNSYFQNTQNPYSESDFESSPLNRVMRQAAPGNIWAMDNGKEIKMEYQTNHSNEVFHFTVANPNSTPTLVLSTTNNGRYPANQLYKTITKDENWQPGNGSNGVIEEFKNKLGQVVLKRIHTSISGRTAGPTLTLNMDTYYVYDDYGNLTFVLSPKLSQQIVSNGSLIGNHQHLLDELGYRYRYDHRNRLINKKLPGRQPELIAYDALNRVIAVGPVQSPFMGDSQEGFISTKYDHFNRVVYTLWRPGAFTNIERLALEAPQTYISETRTTQPIYIDGIPVYYTNNVNPSSSDKLLTINYYDDYNFPGAPSSIPAVVGENNEIDVYYNNTVKPKGMPTGSWTRALEEFSEINGLTTHTLYDKKSRPVRTHTTNHLGGYTQTDTEYDFIKVISTYTTHKKTAASDVVSIRENMEYTPEDRMQKLTHTINQGNEEMLSFNEYDALGQLKAKKVGGNSQSSGDYHQKVDFKYNIRGWLTGINNVSNLVQAGEPQDLFAFGINYTHVTNTVNGNVTPLYNGNIAETVWRTSSDNIRRRYSYTYDFTNRLLDAWYSIPGSAVSNSYNEHLTYDANGNILTLQRYGELESDQDTVMIDDLEYFYDDGNKLINVTDYEGNPAGFKDDNIHTVPMGEDDFVYDDYGNLIMDRNKNIDEITYNHLNLPKTIFFDVGEIHYIYDANGIKLKKTVNDYNTGETDTHYLNGFQYTDDHLDFFPHAEGYVNVLEYAEFNYVYTYKDHLGNIRLRYTLDPNTDELAILKEDHYYPFGLKHQGYNNDHEIFLKEDITGGIVFLIPVTPFEEDKYKYKFKGQERQDEFGLNWDTFRHRNYMPDIGRFFGVDPVAGDYVNISTYQFAHNNPVWKIEIEGLEGHEINGFDVINAPPSGNSANNPAAHIPLPIGNQSGYSNTRAAERTDNTTFSQGWNKTVSNFNNNFWNGFNSFMRDPVNEGGRHINEATLSTAQIVADASGASYLMGWENKTASALNSLIDSICSIPDMTNEELGGLAAGVFIFAVEASASRKMPSSTYTIIPGGKSSVKNIGTNVSLDDFGANLQANGFTRSVSRDGKVTNYTNGDIKYSVRNNSQSTGGATADFYSGDKLKAKIRLGYEE